MAKAPTNKELAKNILTDVEFAGKTLLEWANLISKEDFFVVVRCEKCKYFFDDCCNHPKNRVIHKVPDFGKHYAYVAEIKVKPNHFCSYGERRKEE